MDESLDYETKKIVSERSNIILLGDSISDIRMAQEKSSFNTLKSGFLEENIEENMLYFDVICTNNTDYNELSKKIEILKRY